MEKITKTKGKGWIIKQNSKKSKDFGNFVSNNQDKYTNNINEAALFPTRKDARIYAIEKGQTPIKIRIQIEEC